MSKKNSRRIFLGQSLQAAGLFGLMSRPAAVCADEGATALG